MRKISLLMIAILSTAFVFMLGIVGMTAPVLAQGTDPTPTQEHNPATTPMPDCTDLDNFIVETTVRLNLRNDASTSSRVIEVLPTGKRLEVQACQISALSYPWLSVLTLPELSPGYVSSSYVQKIAPVGQSLIFIRAISFVRNIRSGAGLTYEPTDRLSPAVCAAVNPNTWRQTDGWVWYEMATGYVTVKPIGGALAVRFYEDQFCSRQIAVPLP